MRPCLSKLSRYRWNTLTRVGLGLACGIFLTSCENPMGASNTEDSFLGGTSDVTPLAPTAMQDGSITASSSATPTLSWGASPSAASANFGGYEVAIGTSAGQSDILKWTHTGYTTTATLSSGFTLSDGSTYYASVRARSQGGKTSSSSNGDGFLVNTLAATFNCNFSSGSSTDCYSSPYLTAARPLLRLYRSGGANTSPGTYVNALGKITTAPTNMNLRSEEFEQGAWTKINMTVTADASTAPNGSATADKLIRDTNAGVSHYIAQATPMVAGETWCASYYLKAGEMERAWIVTGNVALPTYQRIDIHLPTGAITGTSGNPAVYGIQAIGGGWHRAHLCAQATVTGSGAIFLQLVDNNNVNNTAGNGVDGIYAWGAQLEKGSAPTPYTYTSTATSYGPRLDHDPSSCAPSCQRRGLLLEAQGQNRMLYSSNLLNAAWSNQSGNTSAAAGFTGPDGSSAATLLTDSSATLNSYLGQAAAITDGTDNWTCSIYLKAGSAGATTVLTNLYGGATSRSNGATIDWATKAVTVGLGSYTLTDAGDGWYRLSSTISNNNSGNTTGACYVYPASWVSGGATTGSVYAWGGQLERASTASSYIPTTSTLLTRMVDMAEAVSTADWLNAAKGTLVAEGTSSSRPESGTFPSLAYLRSTNDDAGVYFRQVNSSKACRIVRSSITEFAVNQPYSFGSFTKIGIAYQGSDTYCAADGAALGSTTSAGVPNITSLTLGPNDGPIKSVQYFDERLSNAKLNALTK